MQRIISSRPVGVLLVTVFLALAVWFGWNALHGPTAPTDPMLQTAQDACLVLFREALEERRRRRVCLHLVASPFAALWLDRV